MNARHWHYGHNVAGYLPESDEPAAAWPWDEARSGLQAEIQRELDALDYAEDDARSVALDLSLQSAWAAIEAAAPDEDFLAYTDDGGPHTIPTAWWVTSCTESECAEATS